MPKKTTRRQFMSMSGLGALGFLSGCSETSFRDLSSIETGQVTAEPEANGPRDEKTQHNRRAETSGFSDETLSRASELGRTVQQSVVKLTSGGAGGTGWVIEDGYIITNSHVTRDFKTMNVETFDGRSGTASRVGYHEDMLPDIALMKTKVEAPEPLPMKTNPEMAKGDPVLTVGHPGRVGDWVISLGRYERYVEGINWELANIPSSQGNSGAPLVTLDGPVYGCISGSSALNGRSSRVNRSEKVYTKFPQQERFVTAIPSKTIQKWVDKWK